MMPTGDVVCFICMGDAHIGYHIKNELGSWSYCSKECMKEDE